MNQRDQDTLAALLAQLWDTRNPGPRTMTGLNPYQKDLLAAAIRIVTTQDPGELPNPWPANWLHKTGTPRPEFTDPPSRITMLADWLDKRIGPLFWRKHR